MRLPLNVAHEIRARELIAPRERVLVALSGGADSVALLRCMLELSHKRDLAFTLSAAHLHHGIRGADADADGRFCEKLCAKLGVPLLSARVDAPALAKKLKRSLEEAARIARHAFLDLAATRANCQTVAVAHHADDRIETVLYRLCRGTGLAGLQGIQWTGPLRLDGEPDVREAITDFDANESAGAGTSPARVVRPLLACSRSEILAYLGALKQNFRTDRTNFDDSIPRNAIRARVLPLLEKKVHPGVRATLWRLAEESESTTQSRAWRRQWLLALAAAGRAGAERIALNVPPDGNVGRAEIEDVLETIKSIWNLGTAEFSRRHVFALSKLFEPHLGPRRLDLPGGLIAERRGKVLSILKKT